MSSTFGAVYARVPAGGVPALEAAIKEARAVSKHSSPLGVLAFDPALHAFAVVDRWGPQDNMPIWAEYPDLGMAFELAALSRSVGEVIAFHEIDEGLTQGFYGGWKDGTLVRDLQWMDGMWIRVEGEPQPWETPMFTDEAFKYALEIAADDPEPVRAAFSKRRIEVQAAWPTPVEISRNICKVHSGPAFGFRPWPRRNELVDKNRELDGKKKLG
jgi:hypothetical protein